MESAATQEKNQETTEELSAFQDTNTENDDNKPDNMENLEQAKREANEFNAENNTAQNQVFIQDIGAGGFTINYYGQNMVPFTSKLPVDKKYDLQKKEECIEFINEFKNSEYFTAAAVLCIFESVVLADLSDLQAKLKEHLPKEEIYDSNGKEISTTKKNPYIALDSIMTVIRGKKFTTENGWQCVSLGQNSKQALNNMLEQFPVLQKAFLDFFIQLLDDYKYRSFFYEPQIARTLANIMSFGTTIDKYNEIFMFLYKNSYNAYLSGRLLYNLYMIKTKEKELKRLIFQWLSFDKAWLWRAVCFCYMLFPENDKSLFLEKELQSALSVKIFSFSNADYDFTSRLLIHSKAFRTMFCNVFYNSYKESKTTFEKEKLAQIYVKLVKYNYYRVNSNFRELPLVACDTKQQQVFLRDILEKIMLEYHLRKSMYNILKFYLKELSGYDFSQKVIMHLAAFFFNMSITGKDYKEDVIDFLKECDNKAAGQIVDILCKTNDEERNT